MNIKKRSILGVGISCIALQQTVHIITQWARLKEKHIVICRDSRGVVYCQDDPAFMALHEQASLVTPDGVPLVWLLQLLGEKNISRVCGPDLMHALCAQTQDQGIKHFFYGSSHDTVSKLRNNLLADYQNLEIVGAIAPPFRELSDSEKSEHIERINASGADIVWVGLGSPKQEYWANIHRVELKASVVITVGAAFDWGAKTVKRAPKLIQHSGMEWAYRLMLEPKRLWKRTLVDNRRFVTMIFSSLISTYMKK